MDKDLLLYMIKKNGYTVGQFCKILGISISAFYRKCNGQTEFRLNEIKMISEILHLESVEPIFFADKVS